MFKTTENCHNTYAPRVYSPVAGLAFKSSSAKVNALHNFSLKQKETKEEDGEVWGYITGPGRERFFGYIMLASARARAAKVREAVTWPGEIITERCAAAKSNNLNTARRELAVMRVLSAAARVVVPRAVLLLSGSLFGIWANSWWLVPSLVRGGKGCGVTGS